MSKTITTDKFRLEFYAANELQQKKGIVSLFNIHDDVQAIVPLDLTEDVRFLIKGVERNMDYFVDHLIGELRRLSIKQACFIDKDFASKCTFAGSNLHSLQWYDDHQALKKEFDNETPI